jgi:hypothetical protein
MYAIRYFRDADVVRWYVEHGITNRPVGYVVGMSRFETEMAARREADHINELGPSVPVEVVRANGSNIMELNVP